MYPHHFIILVSYYINANVKCRLLEHAHVAFYFSVVLPLREGQRGVKLTWRFAALHESSQWSPTTLFGNHGTHGS